MSKYYRAEDVIRKRAENLADTSYLEWGNPKNIDDWIEVAEMEFADLPTIEIKDNNITQFETQYMLNSRDIIRCYNCKHYREEDVGVGVYQWCELLQREVEIDWYCASGEVINNE